MINGLLARFRAALIQDKSSPLTFRVNNLLLVILLSSVGVTTLVRGASELKWLQFGELNIYDRMLRSRPQEPTDNRILLVAITQEDLETEKWPLSDQTINNLLAKLEYYKPRVIGLNIYRHQQQNLAATLPNPDHIIGTCLLSDIGRSEVDPPPNFPIDNIGFDDVVTDNDVDQVIRRALLFSESNDQDNKCQTKLGFGALLAISYLEKQGIKYTFTKNQELKIGNTIFPRLGKNAGSYQDTDNSGYQILLNYRHPNNLIQQVTLTQVLKGEVNPNLIQDRLVIIGTTAASIHPGYYTPYSSLSNQAIRTPRVLIHAQIASQIISSVLDHRPLIYYWPDWYESLWIWSCALVGAILAWQWRHPLMLIIVEFFIIVGIVGIAAGLYLQAIWIPLFTPSLALFTSSLFVMGYTTYQTQKQNQALLATVEKREEAIAQLSLLWQQSTKIPSSFSDFAATEISIFKTDDLLLYGRYKISKTLASGGFGRTYLAEDTQRQGNPICVVKQLMPARRDTRFMEVARRLFNTEAEILDIVGKHPQIPELFASFEENQEFYLVQEYIAGHTLHEELPPETDVKSEFYVVEMLKQVLEVLVFIHEHRVIHRDIKPSNIIRCTQNNRLVLIDFGAVKLMQPRMDEATEMATVAIGTKGYSPPEQFAGHPRLASDIYALGIIAIQAITAISPQELMVHPETGNIMWREGTHVSDELAAILDKMVCYHFGDRYQSATAVLEDLKLLVVREQGTGNREQ
jgi:CHASE2 domain-containing sensor protein/tRNA A-37 threonylcarbamoyl transferase component Bud32